MDALKPRQCIFTLEEDSSEVWIPRLSTGNWALDKFDIDVARMRPYDRFLMIQALCSNVISDVKSGPRILFNNIGGQIAFDGPPLVDPRLFVDRMIEASQVESGQITNIVIPVGLTINKYSRYRAERGLATLVSEFNRDCFGRTIKDPFDLEATRVLSKFKAGDLIVASDLAREMNLERIPLGLGRCALIGGFLMKLVGENRLDGRNTAPVLNRAIHCAPEDQDATTPVTMYEVKGGMKERNLGICLGSCSQFNQGCAPALARIGDGEVWSRKVTQADAKSYAELQTRITEMAIGV